MRIARATERSKAVRRGVRLRRVSWTRTAARRYSDRAPPATSRLGHADVAQLVEHHLAKVRVAGSSPVIRSQSGIHSIPLGVVGWPRGEAAACKAVYTGSNPVPTSGDWRRGSALPSHGRGHWFDPSIAHHISRTVRSGFLYFPSRCVMVWGYRLPELSRALQTLELQQCCFKDLSGGLDQHMRSLTHLLAAGWSRPGFARRV